MKNSQYFLVVVLLFFLNTLEAGIVKLESISSEFYTEFDGEEVSIDIFDPETDEILIQVDVDPGDYEVIKKGEVWKVNSKQEFIFYKDYNSDGLKDIAVKTGEICGVPQLTVYFKKAGQKFSESNSYVLPSDQYVDNENVLDYILKLDDFSEEYFAVVDGKKKHLCIIDKKSKKILANANIEDVDLEYEASNNFQSNVVQRPYGDQSLIIYEDFNFDGKKDFAIKNGNHSCYGGPSFVIYIKKGSKFYLDDDFTRIAQEYCGMFGVDNETKTIHAMTKSGCCWHLFDTYKVENGKLTLVNSVEEDAYNFPFYSVTTKVYKEKEVFTEKRVELNENEINQKLRFELKNGKTALVFEKDNNLYYVLFDKSKNVEFHIAPVYDETVGWYKKSFIFDEHDNDREELNFNTDDAKYSIYQVYSERGLKRIGITVETKGKLYDLAGKPESVSGSLRGVISESVENVCVLPQAENKYALDIYKKIKGMTPDQLAVVHNHYDQVNFLRKPPIGEEKAVFDNYLAKLKQALMSKDKYRLLPLMDVKYLANHIVFNGINISHVLDERMMSGYNISVSKEACERKSSSYVKGDGCAEAVNLRDVVDVEIKLAYREWHSGMYTLEVFFKKNDGEIVQDNYYVGREVDSEGNVKFMIFGSWG